MSFFSKMQNALANWMQGRNGPDNLGFTALIAAIVFSLLSLFRLPLASFLSMLCYVYALWRMLSRNVAKRQEENRQFMDKTGHAQTRRQDQWFCVIFCSFMRYSCPSGM